MVGNFLTYLVR